MPRGAARVEEREARPETAAPRHPPRPPNHRLTTTNHRLTTIERNALHMTSTPTAPVETGTVLAADPDWWRQAAVY